MKRCQNMFNTKRSKNNMRLVRKRLETGLNKVESTIELSKINREKPGFTISSLSADMLKRRQRKEKSIEYSTQEYRVKNKSKILNDRSTCCKRGTQEKSLSQTSEVDSTLKDQAFPNWWSEYVEEKSQKLWLPTKIDLQGLDMTYLNKSVMNTVVASWFSAQIQTSKVMKIKSFKKTYSQSSMSLLQEETEEEQANSKKPEPNSLRKIRLFPNQKQREKLNQIFHGNRYAYNLLVEKSREDKDFFSSKESNLKKDLRPLVQKKTMSFPYSIKDIPEEALDSAFRDFFKARKTTLALSKAQKNKTGNGFVCKLGFKSKKSISQSIEIRARSIKQEKTTLKFWHNFFGFRKKVVPGIRFKGDFPELSYSCRLQRNRDGKFYLCIPGYKKFPKTTSTKVCAIDPGVRTMLTGYDPDGFVFEFGTNLDKIMRRAVHVDKLTSKLRSFKGKRNKRHRLKKTLLYTRRKISNMISDCHHKVTKWLSENYSTVYLPKFQTKQMVKKGKRKIGRRTAREMISWSHYKFKELLRYKMNRTGGKLIDCTEEYTSKACTNCGRLNHNLGASKEFTCSFCRFSVDRDVNGARNIYLKNSKLLSSKKSN